MRSRVQISAPRQKGFRLTEAGFFINTRDEIVAPLNVIKSSCRNSEPRLILLLLNTGLRASEVFGLRVKDIDLLAGKLRTMGKGGKERTVPFQTSILEAIERYFKMCIVILIGCDSVLDEWMKYIFASSVVGTYNIGHGNRYLSVAQMDLERDHEKIPPFMGCNL